MSGPGQTQRAILDLLKRGGNATIPGLARQLGLNIETVRGHLKALTALALVRRESARRSGPGRPEIVYGLTPDAEALFPRREGALLRELAAYLKQSGNGHLLRKFIEHGVEQRRDEALARVAHLRGRHRLEEVARILSELGFMARVEGSAETPTLRLCHCPIRALVDATRVPCRAELGFIAELLGERPARLSYIPNGEPSCSYAVAR
ncbi:MAG TPA: winged helix-turn-helix transcriptional regulator [Gemmatimonadales bacterium]